VSQDSDERFGGTRLKAELGEKSSHFILAAYLLQTGHHVTRQG
jgi:hypothetical protein